MNKKENRNQRIELRLSKTEKEKIEKLANELEIPPSTFIRNLVLTSYDDAIIFNKIGLLKGAKRIKDFREKYTKLIKEINNDAE